MFGVQRGQSTMLRQQAGYMRKEDGRDLEAELRL
jgi:hypothetical protein